MQVGTRYNEFLRDAGVLVRINDAAMAVGQIRAFNTASNDPTKAPPAVMISVKAPPPILISNTPPSNPDSRSKLFRKLKVTPELVMV